MEAIDISSVEWQTLTPAETAKYVEYIIAHPAKEYLQLIHDAEAHRIAHYEEFLARSGELYEAIVPLIAEEDGLVTVDD